MRRKAGAKLVNSIGLQAPHTKTFLLTSAIGRQHFQPVMISSCQAGEPRWPTFHLCFLSKDFPLFLQLVGHDDSSSSSCELVFDGIKSNYPIEPLSLSVDPEARGERLRSFRSVSSHKIAEMP